MCIVHVGLRREGCGLKGLCDDEEEGAEEDERERKKVGTHTHDTRIHGMSQLVRGAVKRGYVSRGQRHKAPDLNKIFATSSVRIVLSKKTELVEFDLGRPRYFLNFVVPLVLRLDFFVSSW